MSNLQNEDGHVHLNVWLDQRRSANQARKQSSLVSLRWIISINERIMHEWN